jgi:signal transduction histidine kinase
MLDTSPPSTAQAIARLQDEIEHADGLQAALECVLDAACALTHADTGAVGLHDPVTDNMRVVALRHTLPANFQRVFARGEGMAGHILATGARFLGRYASLPRPRVPDMRDHETLGLPILWRGRVRGHLSLSLQPPRTFRSADLDVLEIFTRIAATAIERENYRGRFTHSQQRFELVSRIATTLQRHSDDIDTLLQFAADTIHTVLNYPNVDIPLIDPDDPETLVVRIRGGAYKDQIDQVDRLPLDRGIMATAVRTRGTQLVNDARNDPRYICPPGVTPARAELAVPIGTPEQVYGVLNVESDEPFDSLDTRTIEVVAGFLGVAIDNAKLFSRVADLAIIEERQRLARELHDNVTQILASMNLLSQTIASTWKRSPAEGEARALRVQQLAQSAFAELRMLLQQLAPKPTTHPAPAISRKSRVLLGAELLRTQGLPGALNRLLATQVPEHIATRSDFSGWLAQHEEHEQAMFRVCQEAISNCIRHAGAKRLHVEAGVAGEHAVMRIADDGRGLGTDFRPGMGLGNMRSRVEALRGTFRIGANSPRGTVIETRLPRRDTPANPQPK